jgi:hypothetical protein
MSKINVTPTGNGSSIQLTELGDDKARVVSKVTACASGNSSCALVSRGDVEQITLQKTADGLRIDVVTKSGESLEPSSVEECLTASTADADAKEACC